MLVEIIGARRDINFNDDSGKAVIGCKVFWAFEEQGVVGRMTEGKFFNATSPLYRDSLCLNPGDKVEVSYGRNNRIDHLEVISSGK